MRILRGLASIGRRLARSNGASQPPLLSSPNPAPVPYAPTLLAVSPGNVVRCRAKPQAVKAWQERHWQVRTGLINGGIPAVQYSGFYYTVGGRKFRGLIVETSGEVKAYMFDPPLKVIGTYTTHLACFRPREKGAYWVHFEEIPRSVDEAILNIEIFLNELEQKAGWPKVASSQVIRASARGNGDLQ